MKCLLFEMRKAAFFGKFATLFTDEKVLHSMWLGLRPFSNLSNILIYKSSILVAYSATEKRFEDVRYLNSRDLN